MTIICGGGCEEKQVAARDKVVSLVAHLHNLQHPRFSTHCVCYTHIDDDYYSLMIVAHLHNLHPPPPPPGGGVFCGGGGGGGVGGGQ